MSSHTHPRYKRLVAMFAASSFALLSLLTLKQQEANTVAASVVESANVLTNYRQ